MVMVMFGITVRGWSSSGKGQVEVSETVKVRIIARASVWVRVRVAVGVRFSILATGLHVTEPSRLRFLLISSGF